MRSLIVVVLAGVLTACASSSINDLKTRPGGKMTFELDRNYQAVYRNVLDWSRACQAMSGVGWHSSPQGDLYTDRQEGQVLVVRHMPGSTDYVYRVDITAQGEASTLVEAYYAWEMLGEQAAFIQTWAADGSGPCR